MKDFINIKIYKDDLFYDHILINKYIIKTKIKKERYDCQKQPTCGYAGDFVINVKTLVIKIDGILTHYIVQELKLSPSYRKMFLDAFENHAKNSTNRLLIKLNPPPKEIIDYAWNYRTNTMVWERLELDHALSWLSTLGGAFSALGDYITHCATIAGKISFHQFKLAMRLGDPTVTSRCRLYLSLSLIQRGYLKQAKIIILQEFHWAKSELVIDKRLVNMCQGIWAKLKYEYEKKNAAR